MTIKKNNRKPTLAGELFQEGENFKTADSDTLTTGSVASGTVVDTRTLNKVYYQIEEVTGSPGFEIEFNFTLVSNPGRLTIIGRYEGGAAHVVIVEAWNYTLMQWDRFTGSATDILNTSVDVTYDFDYADLTGAITDYISGTDSKIRVIHTSSGNINHDIYFDFIDITERQFTIATGGIFQVITVFQAGISKGVQLDAPNGTMTILKPSLYRATLSVSFLGTDSETFEGHVFVDGVKVDKIGTRRSLGSGGDVGATPMSGLLDLVSGQVVDVRFTSNLSGSWASIENINFSLKT